jgi:hypothetical protein
MSNRKVSKKTRCSKTPQRRDAPQCPDFDLAPLRKFRRDVLQVRQTDDEQTAQIKRLTLALGLAFNDLKDLAWHQSFKRSCSTPGSRRRYHCGSSLQSQRPARLSSEPSGACEPGGVIAA